MSLIKWEPFGDFDRFFNDSMGLSNRLQNMSFDLSIDVYEEGGNVVAEMNLPGVDPEKLDISVEDGYLTIAGSREETKEENDKDKHYYSKEIKRGSFSRMVRLPYDVEKEKVEAEFEQGVLKVVLPKRAGGGDGKVKVTVKK